MYVAMKGGSDSFDSKLDGLTPSAVAENTFLARVSPVHAQEASGRDLRAARDKCALPGMPSCLCGQLPRRLRFAT